MATRTPHLHPAIPGFLIGLLVAACSRAVPQTTATPSAAATAVPTSTPAPSATFPPATSTHAPLDPTQTMAAPSPTPLATLNGDDARATALTMLQTNGDCRLPCWWGITPGETDWLEARNFLGSFAIKMAGVESSVDPEVMIYGAYFDYGAGDDRITSQEYYVRDNNIDLIRTAPVPSVSPVVTAADLLADYGPPSDVRISTFPEPYNGFLPFWLVIVYSNNGIVARFETEAEIQDQTITACFSEARASFWLWPAVNEVNLDEVASTGWSLTAFELLSYRPLAEATTLDAETLYLASLDRESRLCLETSAGLWSLP